MKSSKDERIQPITILLHLSHALRFWEEAEVLGNVLSTKFILFFALRLES